MVVFVGDTTFVSVNPTFPIPGSMLTFEASETLQLNVALSSGLISLGLALKYLITGLSGGSGSGGSGSGGSGSGGTGSGGSGSGDSGSGGSGSGGTGSGDVGS